MQSLTCLKHSAQCRMGRRGRERVLNVLRAGSDAGVRERGPRVGLRLHVSAQRPGGSWTPTARLAAWTGGYISIAGCLLTVAPRFTFEAVFDLSGASVGWIRVGGVLASLFGAYYLGAAHGEVTGSGLRSMYWATVWGRAYLSLAFVAIASSGGIPGPVWGLTALAALNLLGAASMAFQLWRSK